MKTFLWLNKIEWLEIFMVVLVLAPIDRKVDLGFFGTTISAFGLLLIINYCKNK